MRWGLSKSEAFFFFPACYNRGMILYAMLMKSPKEMFSNIGKNIYDPTFYATVPEEKASTSVKYFAKLVFAVSCVVALFPIALGIGLLTWKQDTVRDIREQIVATFPQELVIRTENHSIKTNVEEPYAIPLPDALKKEMAGEGMSYDLENLLVIDTTKPIGSADFKEGKTALIIGKDEFGILTPDKGKVEIMSLGEMNDGYKIDRAAFGTFVGAVWNVLKIVGVVLMILMPFLIFAGLFSGYAIYLLFGALAVWLGAKIAGKKLGYGQSYKTGLRLITLPFLGSFLLPFVFHAPFACTLFLGVLAYVNFKGTREAVAEIVPSSSESAPESTEKPAIAAEDKPVDAA